MDYKRETNLFGFPLIPRRPVCLHWVSPYGIKKCIQQLFLQEDHINQEFITQSGVDFGVSYVLIGRLHCRSCGLDRRGLIRRRRLYFQRG